MSIGEKTFLVRRCSKFANVSIFHSIIKQKEPYGTKCFDLLLTIKRWMEIKKSFSNKYVRKCEDRGEENINCCANGDQVRFELTFQALQILELEFYKTRFLFLNKDCIRLYKKCCLIFRNIFLWIFLRIAKGSSNISLTNSRLVTTTYMLKSDRLRCLRIYLF